MAVAVAVVAWVSAGFLALCVWYLTQRNSELSHEIDRANERLDAGFMQAQLPGCNTELETRLRQRESELRDQRMENEHLRELVSQHESDIRELQVKLQTENTFRRGVVELLAKRSNGDLMPQGEAETCGSK